MNIKNENQEPSLVEPEIVTEPTGPRHLSQSQAKAFHELSAFVGLAGHVESYGGFVPRAKPLLIGPSGCGKTALVRRLCDSERLKLLPVNSGSWIVFGASAEPATLTVIRSFVRKNEKGCILMDEIDKCCPIGQSAYSQSWNLSVFSEILATLDSDERLCTSGWSIADVERLRRNFYIIGAGAWQLKAKEGKDQSLTHAQAVIADFGIPEEVAFRFNARVVFIEAPNRKDFADAIKRVHLDLGLDKIKPAVLEKMVDAAVEARCGMRWVEQYVSDVLSANPHLRRKSEPPPEKKPGKTVVARWYYNQEKENFHRLLEAAEPAVSHLRVHLKMIASRIWADSTEATLDIGNDNVMTKEKLDQCFDDLLCGLHFRYAVNDEERKKCWENLWVAGNRVRDFCHNLVTEKPEFLAAVQVLPTAINASTRLSRILSALRYIASLEQTNDEI